MKRYEDLTGKIFGDLLVTEKAESGNNAVYWRCKCRLCGKISRHTRYDLNKSIGVFCKKKKLIKKGNTSTLCWTCHNALGGCSWTGRDPITGKIMFQPVEGWTAIPTITLNGKYDGKYDTSESFLVTDCPLYKQDERRKQN